LESVNFSIRVFICKLTIFVIVTWPLIGTLQGPISAKCLSQTLQTSKRHTFRVWSLTSLLVLQIPSTAKYMLSLCTDLLMNSAYYRYLRANALSPYRYRYRDERPWSPTQSQIIHDRVERALRRDRSLERLDRLRSYYPYTVCSWSPFPLLRIWRENEVVDKDMRILHLSKVEAVVHSRQKINK